MNIEASPYLLSLQERIEYEAGIRHHVCGEGMNLLYTPPIGRARLSKIGDGDVVVRAVCCPPGEFVAHVRRGRMRQIVVY